MMSFSLLFRLSLRNLLRHRRRNLLMLGAIVVAVATVVTMNALVRGMQVDLANGAVDNLTGHIKVLAPGYLDDPSIERSFPLPEDLSVDLASLGLSDLDPALIDGWAARVRVPAVIMSERETRGIQLVGVDPAQERISFLGHTTYDGEALADSLDKRVIIGRALAEQLQTRVGRRLVIITQGIDGANREAGFRIGGVYDAEGDALEKVFVFTGRERLQKLLDAPVVTELSVRLKEEPSDWRVQDLVSGFFDSLEVLNWQELEPQAAAMFVLADTAIFIWFLILMGALAFGLVNTLITAVMERIRELGMLRALGMRPGYVVAQVVLESSLLMLAGVVAGCLLGLGCIYLLRDGIDLTQWAQGMETVGISSVMTPELRRGDVWMVAIMSMVLGVLASLYPAIHAVRMKPLEALRR